MARLKFGIFGPISGKLGSVIGATWKGIPYLRMPSEKSNRERSPAQLANEGKFKYVNDWLIPFHPYLSIGYMNLAEGKTALAAALSANYKTVFTGMYPDIQVHYEQFRVSMGPLAPLGNPQVMFVSEDTLELSWGQNYSAGAAYNDQVVLVLYSEELRITDGFVGASNRAAERHSFSINPRLVGQVLHVYMSVTSLSRDLISDSIYLGTIHPL